MIQVDESVAVVTNHDGQPISIDWRGSSYLASGSPVRWYARKSWWTEAVQAPKGIGPQLVETEMWRVRAHHESEGGVFELRHNLPEDEWKLVRII